MIDRDVVGRTPTPVAIEDVGVGAVR
jgi:hypothetical protein